MKNDQTYPGIALLMLTLLLAGFSYLAASAQARAGEVGQETCADFVGPLTPVDESLSILAYQDVAYLTPSPALPPALESLTERAGFSVSIGTDTAVWADTLGSDWYLDWHVKERRTYHIPEHWQMVRVSPGCTTPSRADIRWMALHFPGQVWVIGNEPDVIWQDNLPAREYAQVYHDLYTLIKRSDPHAQVAVGAVSQPTPLRLQYLDEVLATYQELYGTPLPADWWTVHAFVLREERASWGVDIPPGMPEVDQGTLYSVYDHGDPDIFAGYLSTFRAWMAKHGYRDMPLAVTEFGILMPEEYGFAPEFVAQYLTLTFNILNTATDDKIGYSQDHNRLVQRWAWFSLADRVYPSSNLVDLRSGQLTPAGLAFREFIIHQKP